MASVVIATSLLIAAAFAAQSPAPGVNVSDPAVVHEPDGFYVIEFDFANKTGETITAWMVDLKIHLSDGTDEQTGQGKNGVLQYAALLTQEQAVQQWIDRLEAEGAAYDAHRRAKASRRVAPSARMMSRPKPFVIAWMLGLKSAS